MECLKIGFLIVFIVVLTFSGVAYSVENGGYSNPKALISPAQLEKMIADKSVKVIDVRGSKKYNLGHIEGALDIGIFDLDAEKNGVPLMLPDIEKFAEVMSENGITNDDFVVIYDEVGGFQAARLACEFLQFGHFKVALLDGGWDAWKGSADLVKPSITTSVFKASNDGKLFASIDDVKAALGRPEFVILDSRVPDEYAGETVVSGSGKGGHIPGAINVAWSENIDTDKFIKSAEELKKIYEDSGVTPDKTIIAYCHIGYRSSFSAYILKELLGYPNVIIYDGSWSEWSNTDAPVEK